MLRILAAAAVLTLAAPASAQDVEPSESVSQIDYQAELDSINAESTWATALYIAGLALNVGGAIAATYFFYRIVLCATDGPCHGFDDAKAGAPVALVISGIGLLTLVTGIGLDVDSGSRRGALEARRPEGVELTSVSVTPTEGGAALQLGGRF